MKWILILLFIVSCRTIKKQEISRVDSTGISSSELRQDWASETLREYRLPAMQLPTLNTTARDTTLPQNPEPVIIREYIRQKANTVSNKTEAVTVKSEDIAKETSSNQITLYLLIGMGLELIIILLLILVLIYRPRR